MHGKSYHAQGEAFAVKYMYVLTDRALVAVHVSLYATLRHLETFPILHFYAIAGSVVRQRFIEFTPLSR